MKNEVRSMAIRKFETTINTHLLCRFHHFIQTHNTASILQYALPYHRKDNNGKPDTIALNIHQENRKTLSHKSIITL